MGQTGGNADTTEAIERTLALAVRYAMQPHELATAISDNARLTQIDDVVLSMTVAYGAVLGLLVQGHKLDKNLSGTMMQLVKSGQLDYCLITNQWDKVRDTRGFKGASHRLLLRNCGIPN